MKYKKRSDGADVTPDSKPEEERTPKDTRRTELSVILYTVILFAVALGLILLSYAVMQRDAGAPPEAPELAGTLDAGGPETYHLHIEKSITEGHSRDRY